MYSAIPSRARYGLASCKTLGKLEKSAARVLFTACELQWWPLIAAFVHRGVAAALRAKTRDRLER